jgi:hypothetical protein
MSSIRFVPGSGAHVRVVSRLALFLALLTLAVLALTGAIDLLQGGTLTMLPAIALAVAMLTRPYVGERLIARMRRSPRPCGACAPAIAYVRVCVCLARGGRLIAAALAGRAPPLALALAACR